MFFRCITILRVFLTYQNENFGTFDLYSQLFHICYRILREAHIYYYTREIGLAVAEQSIDSNLQ